MNSYRIEVGGEYAIIICVAVLAVVFSILWFVPAQRRKMERTSAELLSIRVMTVCKKGYVYSSQILTRLTLYEDRLVWCHFSVSAFAYEYVKIENPLSNGALCLTISIHGIPVKLWGAATSLEKFSAILEKKNKSFLKNHESSN